MRKGLTYGGKRVIGIVLCVLLLIFLFCMFVFSSSNVRRKEILILLFSMGIILLEYFILLYVPSIPEPIAKPMGFLLPILYALKNITDELVPVILFHLICVTFAVLLFFANGHLKNSKEHLKRIRNKICALSEATDWIQQDKKEYPISAVRINTIPNELNNVSSNDCIRLNKALKVFGKGVLLEKRTKRAMLLIGDFGSGKSSALLKYAFNQTRRLFINPNAIPLYVRLTDLFDSKDIANLKDLKPSEYEKWESFLAELREKAYRLYYGNHIAEENKKLFDELNEENRVLYLFDGLNEILQRESKSKSESKSESKIKNENVKADLARSLFDFLWRLVQGNRFVLTTTTYPDVITNRTLQAHENETEIYVIKGIELTREETERQWEPEHRYERLYNSSAALYCLKKEFAEKKPTPFELLNEYVKKVSPNLGDERLTKIVKGILNNVITTPYCSFDLETIIFDKKQSTKKGKADLPKEYTEFIDSRMFRKHPKDGKKDAEEIDFPTEFEYTVCHTLILEFLLAYYAEQFLNTSTSESEIYKNIFIGEGEDKPYILKCPHIQDAFKMFVVDIYVKKKDQISNCQTIIKTLLKEINGCEINEDTDLSSIKNNAKQFILMLSRIQDEIMLFGNTLPIDKTIEKKESAEPDQDYRLFGFCDIKLEKLVSSKEEEVSKRFQLCKLMTKKGQKKQLNELLCQAIGEKWTHIGIKRKILRYYVETFGEWPKSNTLAKSEKKLNMARYLLEEYPAELLELDTMIQDKKEKEQKRISTPFFYRCRIHEIKITSFFYWLLVAFLVIQIPNYIISTQGINIPALIIKFIGLGCCFASMSVWQKQLWKNEEYYGMFLGGISRNEPIYELLDVVFGRGKNEYAKARIGDWLRNRPSIMFLLISVIATAFFHDYLLGLPWSIPYECAMKWEIALAGFLVLICSFPFFTDCIYIFIYIYNLVKKEKTAGPLSMYPTSRKKKPADFRSICLTFIMLVGILFVIPILATSIAVSQWSYAVGLCFAGAGLFLMILIWFFFVRKGHGTKKETWPEQGVSRTNTWIRFISFIMFLALFSGPGVLIYFIALNNKEMKGLWPASILIVLLALSVYLYLLYASLVRIRRNKKNDMALLDEILSKNQYSEGNKWEKFEKNYENLSCSGQIELINRIVGDKNINLKKMGFLKEGAKTVAALDIILDAELYSSAVSDDKSKQ